MRTETREKTTTACGTGLVVVVVVVIVVVPTSRHHLLPVIRCADNGEITWRSEVISSNYFRAECHEMKPKFDVAASPPLRHPANPSPHAIPCTAVSLVSFPARPSAFFHPISRSNDDFSRLSTRLKPAMSGADRSVGRSVGFWDHETRTSSQDPLYILYTTQFTCKAKYIISIPHIIYRYSINRL